MKIVACRVVVDSYFCYSYTDNYDRLNAVLDDTLRVTGEQARGYVNQLKKRVTEARRAVQSGCTRTILGAIDNGANDLEDGAEHAKPSPKLYTLVKFVCPTSLQVLKHSVSFGLVDGKGVTTLAGKFVDMIKAAEAVGLGI